MRTLKPAVRRRAVDAASALLPQRYRRLPDQVAATHEEVQRLSEKVDRLVTAVAQHRAEVDGAYQALLTQLAEHARQRGEDRAELTSLAARVRSASAGRANAASGATPDPAGQPDLDSFYQGFEERFRGSRENVIAKVREYLPAVQAVAFNSAPILDVGPGRCEWLSLLREGGIPAYGVDTNRRFVQMGAELGLDVRLGDAIDHLRGLPDRSLAGVTAFQVAEHLPAFLLFELVDHALRVLQPGGVLILETPNPLNLRIGAAEFWIDPTHQHPLHPQFLEYLLVHRGFTDVEIRMTHSSDDAPLDLSQLKAEATVLRQVGTELNNVLHGPCDYAVIGYRAPVARP